MLLLLLIWIRGCIWAGAGVRTDGSQDLRGAVGVGVEMAERGKGLGVWTPLVLRILGVQGVLGVLQVRKMLVI